MIYEIQNSKLQSFKHTFDYNACKKKYEYYNQMNLKEFKRCLKNRQTIGEIGHLCCFVLWVKHKERYEYRQVLSDYGIIHLLFHCVENKRLVSRHAKEIKELFTKDIKLT